MRYAELSADRLGLIACGDFDVAIRALFKMTSGLCDPRFLQHLSEAAAQYTALAAEALETFEDDWFATHPYSPLRMRALGLFHRSRRYQTFIGRAPRGLTDDDLERQVQVVVDLMNPAFLDGHTQVHADIRRFVGLAGLSLAVCNEPVDAAEVQALASLVGKDALDLDAEAVRRMSHELRLTRLGELSRPLTLALSLLRRQKIVEDLVAVAISDRKISDTEWDLLAAFAELLEVDPTFVDQCVARIVRGLD